MSILSVKGLSKKYVAASDFALSDLNLEVEKGHMIALTGESGCGKTTLLRLVAGLEVPYAGTISINGQLVAGQRNWVKPEQRKVGMVFQDYALFPHLTVAENVIYGISRLPGRQSRVAEVLQLVGLSGYEKRYPHELSGGQQQRVALARALAPQPEILLLDEPFSNLDEVLREQLRDEICNIIRITGKTALLVTHDTKDALTTADKIVLLRKGKLLQYETPRHLYESPADEYTALFFGKINFIAAQPVTEGLLTPIGIFPNTGSTEDKSKVCIRPEHLELTGVNEAKLKARVLKSRFFGSHQEVQLQAEEVLLTSRISSREIIAEGTEVGLRIAHYHLI